jgi:hypothetical protein
MKLILDHREKKEGFIRKSTVYYLVVDLQVTPEEIALIKKHKWEEMPMCTAVFSHTQGLEWTMVLSCFLEGPEEFGFKNVEILASAENQIIQNAKLLKANLESVEGYTTEGPREVEL